MIDALKRASAKRITVVLPFYPYARQDKKHRGREPISARLVADLLKTAGAHRLMAVDLHTDQIQGFFDGPVDHLLAQPLLADYIADEVRRSTTSPSSPPTPAGSAPRRSGRSGSAARPVAFIHKTRDPSQPNQVVANRVVGEVAGHTCVAGRRHDRHRRHHREGRHQAVRGRRQGRGDRRGHPRRAVATRPRSGCRECGAARWC